MTSPRFETGPRGSWANAPGAPFVGRGGNPTRSEAVELFMTCTEFIQHFSDHIDESGSSEILESAARHRDSCVRCRRYEAVFLEGRSLLAGSVEQVSVDEDFHPRLQHRLYHVDDERALARSSAGFNPTVMVMGAVAMVGVLMGVPLLFEPDPEVELSPIVVSVPAQRPLGLRMPLPTLLPRSLSPAALELDGNDLWRQSAALFYEYAPARARYRDASGTRLGLQ